MGLGEEGTFVDCEEIGVCSPLFQSHRAAIQATAALEMVEVQIMALMYTFAVLATCEGFV